MANEKKTEFTDAEYIREIAKWYERGLGIEDFTKHAKRLNMIADKLENKFLKSRESAITGSAFIKKVTIPLCSHPFEIRGLVEMTAIPNEPRRQVRTVAEGEIPDFFGLYGLEGYDGPWFWLMDFDTLIEAEQTVTSLPKLLAALSARQPTGPVRVLVALNEGAIGASATQQVEVVVVEQPLHSDEGETMTITLPNGSTADVEAYRFNAEVNPQVVHAAFAVVPPT